VSFFACPPQAVPALERRGRLGLVSASGADELTRLVELALQTSADLGVT
jgi:hypothetical protein